MTSRRGRSHKTSTRKPRSIVLDGQGMTLEQVQAIADGQRCSVSAAAHREVRRSRALVDRAVASGRQVYGVNTGFGQLADVRIDDGSLDRLQQNLIRSHAAGVGPALSERVVRAILALRVNCLVRGHVAGAGLLERDVVLHHLHDVRLRLQVVDELLGKQTHVRLRCSSETGGRSFLQLRDGDAAAA